MFIQSQPYQGDEQQPLMLLPIDKNINYAEGIRTMRLQKDQRILEVHSDDESSQTSSQELEIAVKAKQKNTKEAFLAGSKDQKNKTVLGRNHKEPFEKTG